ncbi:MAG: hypothetical protein ACTH93_06930 [Pseudoclavibacter sp.]
MHARPRRRPTVTERIDRAVLGVPAERRSSVIFVTSLFGLTACAGLATLALGLSLGSAGGAPVVAGSLLFGLTLPCLVLMVAVVRRRALGRIIWTAMLTAGVIVGAGPLRVLINGGWDAPVFVGGRWGGSLVALRDAAWVLWAVGAALIVSGVLGLASAGRISAVGR